MLKISLIEFFLRTIPESFLIFFGIYILSYKALNKKTYIMSSIVYSISVYSIRLLPINLGVHTIILIMICTMICIHINDIPVIEAISHSFILIITLLICELVNIFGLKRIPNESAIDINNHLTKICVFMPSLVMFILIIFLIRKIISNKSIG